MDEEALPSEIVGSVAEALFPVPVLGPVVTHMAKQVAKEWQRNRSASLKAAVAASGLSREGLAEKIQNEPRLLPLWLHVLWAASMNGHGEVLAAKGAVFGAAASAADDDQLERAELALRALEQLTPRHFSVLQVLEDAVPTVAEDGTRNYSAAVPAAVGAVIGLDEATSQQCLINLVGPGLASMISVYGTFAFQITALGRAVLRAAIEVKP